MINDGDSVLEESNKTTFEDSVGETATSIFSNACKIHKEQEKECFIPLVKEFFTEPSYSGKDKPAKSCKVLIQEIITQPTDKLLSSVCNQPDEPSPWEEERKITIACSGKITAVQLITEKNGWHIHTNVKDVFSSCKKKTKNHTNLSPQCYLTITSSFDLHRNPNQLKIKMFSFFLHGNHCWV